MQTLCNITSPLTASSDSIPSSEDTPSKHSNLVSSNSSSSSSSNSSSSSSSSSGSNIKGKYIYRGSMMSLHTATTPGVVTAGS